MARPGQSLEVHKFGGASLADAAAIRHAVAIIRDRSFPRVIVVSAMAGVTDLLLGVAAASQRGDLDSAGEAARTLRERHHTAVKALVPAGSARTDLLTFVDSQISEL